MHEKTGLRLRHNHDDFSVAVEMFLLHVSEFIGTPCGTHI